MNHAVISCLHANLAAVEAVLDDIDSQGIQNITCLGDHSPGPSVPSALTHVAGVFSPLGIFEAVAESPGKHLR